MWFSLIVAAGDAGLFTFGLWVAVLVLASLTIVWGLVSVAFALFNATSRPVETLTGPMGLYLWNAFASEYMCFREYVKQELMCEGWI